MIGVNQLVLSKQVMAEASRIGIDPNLALAIAEHESNLDPYVTRYEPLWNYFCNPEKYAPHLKITLNTEKVLQAISWGPMQIMGSVARELGYSGNLTMLIAPDPKLSITYACRKLKALKDHFGNDQPTLISAYNCGTPRKIGNDFVNQDYVNDVLLRMSRRRVVT